MLTLQNILDSDTISTLVAKINANFQTISLSNGGPQGPRGEQGIPGLPGKQGSTGPTGPIGATGPAPGIIPFSATTGSTGPVIPQPTASLNFLQATSAWSPVSPEFNQVWFDNNQLGWWKYLTIPDPDTTDPDVGAYIATGPYSASPGFTGPGWYFYPMNFDSITNSLESPWIKDKTNYLGKILGNAYSSPNTLSNLTTQAPFGIANARMTSKFGSVWISSFDKETGETGPGGDAEDNDSSLIYSVDYANIPRLSSGIDRLLFKMSIDGVLYYDNMKARGWRDTDFGSGPIIGFPYEVFGGTDLIPATGPTAIAAGSNPNYFAQPLYNLTIDAYSPILFLTNRNDFIGTQSSEANGSLGYFQYSPGGGGSIQIHNFTTRNAEEFFNVSPNLTDTTNFGEVLFDVRRFITTNQYLNMFPQDTANFTTLWTGPGPKSPFSSSTITVVKEWSGPGGFTFGGAYQGYHSIFTGQKIAENANSGNQAQIADVFTWMYGNRQSWYGTSIFEEEPDVETGQNVELARSAGMMARGRSGQYLSNTGYVDGLLFYTSNMTGTGPNGYTGPTQQRLLSLPVAYMSPTRNFGVGTVTMDKVGVFEPAARLHSHADWRPALEDFGTTSNYTSSLSAGPFSGVNKSWLSYTNFAPLRRMKSAAFTVERASPALIYGTDATGPFWPSSRFSTGPTYFDDWYSRGVFNDILLGAIDTPYHEPAGLGIQMSVKPTSGIRYESFNAPLNTPKIDHGNLDRARGFGWRGALRLGSSPLYTYTGSPFPWASDQAEIGENANYQSVEYQLAISPLSTATPGAAAVKEAISGIGIHNLYPRARFHMYGKNLYQEFRFDEAAAPGFVQPALAINTAVDTATWAALPSNNQIVIDQLLDTYVYNAAMYDYSYDFGITVAGYTGPSGPLNIEFSANARNYPIREYNQTNTAFTYNTSNPQHNRSELGVARSGAGPTYSAVHGGLWNGYWSVDKYIGFNLFRDLLLKGDEKGETLTSLTWVNWTGTSYLNDRYASIWRTGTQGVGKDPSGPADNGGSAIFTDTEGRMGFAFIPKWRDGGANYGKWEQQGIGTREVVNNIKIVFDSYGNIGIGSAPGQDENAYSSLANDPGTGEVYYRPTAFGDAPATLDQTTGPIKYQQESGPYPPTWPLWNPISNPKAGRYGLASQQAYSSSTNTARVNAQATFPEIIRFELGAEKAQGRPGHTPDKRGYGYPGWFLSSEGLPNGTGGVIVITDDGYNTFANRYLGVDLNTPGWDNVVHTITTDNIGRIISYELSGLGSPLDAEPVNTDFIGNGVAGHPALPHPTEFGDGGPFSPFAYPPTSSYPWTADIGLSITINGTAVDPNQKIWVPVSSVAGDLESLVMGEDELNNPVIIAEFVKDALQPANFRMNNFVLGDGYEIVRTDGNSFDLTQVTDASPATTQEIYQNRTSSPKIMLTFGAPDKDSMRKIGVDSTNQDLLIVAGTAPLMKVTTIIDSAQNEASLRTYTVPRADNTGGTFLVITDHMGIKGTVEPGLQPLPGGAGPVSRLRLERIGAYEVMRTATTPYDAGGGFWGMSTEEPPQNFSYEMLLLNYWDNGFLPHTRGVSQLYYPAYDVTSFLAAVGAAELERDINSYWRINTDTYSSRWRDAEAAPLEYKRSEIRYRRLNSDFLMFDFNITLDALDYMQMGGGTVNIDLNQIIGNDGDGGTNLLNYTHSPFTAGFLTPELRDSEELPRSGRTWLGIDARWLQYVRIAYDIGENVVFTPPSSSTIDNDPNYYEFSYGGGANFGNWNDYRPWYPGTAVVGPDVPVNDVSWIENEGFQQGWIPGTDGSPYLRNTQTDVRLAGLGTRYYSKAWNGDFVDWYYGTWNEFMLNLGNTTWAASGVDDDPLKIWANPWAKQKNPAPADTNYQIDDGWFKRTNFVDRGYTRLYRGWCQSVASPAGDGAVGFVPTAGNPTDPYVTLSIPQYFDAVVWRSFGQNAWKRNSEFMWRVTPYWNDKDTQEPPPADGVFNTFVLEIMFKDPIHVSGANRIYSHDNSFHSDNTYFPAGETEASRKKWAVNGNVWGGPTGPSQEIIVSPAQGAVYSLSEQQFEYYLGHDPERTSGDKMRPYGRVTLRGQAMLNYKKYYIAP